MRRHGPPSTGVVGAPIGSRRVAAAVVAMAVAIGAFALVVRAFRPTATVQPSSMPSYSSAAQVFDLLSGAGAGCRHRGESLALPIGLTDSGTCNVAGHKI